MKNEIINLFENSGLLTAISKWKVDEKTTYMFLPVLPDNSEQIFAVLRDGNILHNKFKFNLQEGKPIISFLNTNQSYYLGFSDDYSEMYLKGSYDKKTLTRLSQED